MIIKNIIDKLLDIAWPREDGTYNLSGADLSEAKLSGADLRGADLSRADLSGADLSGAKLSRAYLSGAYLSGAHLSGAYLNGADLSGADLSRAYLSEAKLSGADLSGANLCEANLRGADLTGANLIDAGQDNRGYRFVARQGDPMMIAAGCRWLTIADAREHWANNLECLGKVEMIVAEATRRGWTI